MVPFSRLSVRIPLPDKRPVPPALKGIGDHLKAYRLQKRLPIKDIIKALQISRETLRCWEHGIYDPFPHHYPKIVALLGYYPFEPETANLPGMIRKCRLLLGLTQEEFARKLNVNRASIMYWEDGRRIPTSGSRKKLNKIFRVVSTQFSCISPLHL